jgi:glycosyltransferase involved in cell wall biosynthesis
MRSNYEKHMKIAFIGQKGIPAISGGVEKHVEEIAIRMAEQGHEVFVYVRDNYTDKNLKKYKKVNLIHLPSIPTKHLDAISHTFFSSVHALFCKYDIIHYHAIGPNLMNWIVKVFKPGTALVSTFHCQDYFHQKWGFVARMSLRFGEYMTCKIPDKTICVSKSLSDLAKEKYNSSSVVIPNGAEVAFEKSQEALSEWGLKEKKYILSVGRLIKHKGVHYLIEAFKKLEDTSKLPNNFKLVIVGEGFHTDDYVKYLKTISEGRENIVFTGKQSGKTLAQLFSHATLFVQPSEAEGLSIALLEAMGYGLAPLVSDIKENLEPIGECGFSFKSKNVNDLADKLAYVLNRPNEARSAGMCARGRIETEYGWDSITKRILETYRELLNSQNKK